MFGRDSDWLCWSIDYLLVSDVCGSTEIGADDKSQGIGRRLIFENQDLCRGKLVR